MTPESEYLLSLARRNLQPYLALPQIRAALITGSVALGLSDRYSDIDMMIYCDALPDDDELNAARLRNGGEEIWRVDNRIEGELMESYLELKALVDETIDLVAQHMPQVEVASVKQRLNRRRSAWQMPGAME